MNVIKTAIDGVVIIEPRLFKDDRGYFFESFSERDFNAQVRTVRFVQDNESKSSYGVLRGLHFQKPPFAQSKLVRVVKGAVLDVAVDIRKGTHDSLAEASTYIEVIEKRQGLKVACLEGIALRHGWITAEKMRQLAQPMLKNQYGQYLLKVIDELGLND